MPGSEAEEAHPDEEKGGDGWFGDYRNIIHAQFIGGGGLRKVRDFKVGEAGAQRASVEGARVIEKFETVGFANGQEAEFVRRDDLDGQLESGILHSSHHGRNNPIAVFIHDFITEVRICNGIIQVAERNGRGMI